MSSEPRFRTSEIRRQMDVMTFDNVYLGSILWVFAGTDGSRSGLVRPEAQQASLIGGESMGPAPTQEVGNPGPVTQSARLGYGIGTRDGAPYLDGTMLVGKYYGLMGLKRIPLEDIQTVAMERVVLLHTADHYE